MAQKDMTQKKLEDYVDVFADIFNILLIRCPENDIIPDKLFPGPTESIYKADNLNREQRRDTYKYYDLEGYGAGLHLAALGIENQVTIDPAMPVRIFNYDASSLMQQIRQYGDKLTKTNKIVKVVYPVITIVLNFSDYEWKTNTSLYDIMTLPKNLEKLVQNYYIHVFDIAYLEDEIIDKFTSDFKVVARFFKDKRLGRPMDDTTSITHIGEVAELFSVFTGQKEYKEVVPNMIHRQREGENITMCKFTQELLEKGSEQGKRSTVYQLVAQRALDVDIACSFLDITKAELKENMEAEGYEFVGKC
nr:Rpn family recombination-promoting nuclease/putative transposase [uncultured Anaerobutyricum sp.]